MKLSEIWEWEALALRLILFTDNIKDFVMSEASSMGLGHELDWPLDEMYMAEQFGTSANPLGYSK